MNTITITVTNIITITVINIIAMTLTIDDLKAQNLILLDCVSGSKAYGLATPSSDTDIKGVFYLPKAQFFALHSDYVPQVSNASNDIVYYELGRYVELLLKNNPTVMELLATPDEWVRYRHPLMQKIQPAWVVSKLCEQTFAGFANSQIKKARGLNKKIVNPMSAAKKPITEFCVVFEGGKSVALSQWLSQHGYDQRQIGLASMPHATQMYAMFVDTSFNAGSIGKGELGFSGIFQKPTATQVSLSSIPKGLAPVGYLSFNQMGYSKYCADHTAYWDWVAERNESRYQTTMAHGKQYDAKNMMHTIRLLQTALDIANTGQVVVTRPNRDELLAIKNGHSDYDTLVAWADQLTQQIAEAFAHSDLPDLPDEVALTNALVDIRTQLYQT